MSATYTTRADDRLDLICWRWYGTLAGTVERVLAVNPGLADRDPARLPSGVTIIMPPLQRRMPTPRVF